MRIPAFASVAGLSAGLAGCFIADRPLLTDADSIAPYRLITVREEHSADVWTLLRSGNAYTAVTPDGAVTLRFRAMDRTNWYLVQASGTPLAAGAPGLFYLVVRVDLAAHRAYAFKSIGSDRDVVPGLHPCGDAVCIDDLAAYAASAEAYADSGHAPEVTYEVNVN